MINWNEAPEGATHHAIIPGHEHLDYWLDDKGYWADGNGYYEFELKLRGGENFMHEDFSEITERPSTTKPIYTQEMNDNGLLPEVGMEFIDSGSDSEDVRVCLVIDDCLAVYKEMSSRGVYFGVELSECESLPKPVELIDGKAYQFDYNGKVYDGVYDHEVERFFFLRGHVLSSYCTNIIPLTPEEK